MNVLSNQFKSLAQLRQELRAGRVSIDQVMAECGTYKAQQAVIDSWIKIQALNAKYGRIAKRAINENIVGDGSVIDFSVVDSEHEKVKCPGLNFDLIERHQCLDYSGEKKFPECNGCETGAITKRLLLAKAIEPPRMQQDGKH